MVMESFVVFRMNEKPFVGFPRVWTKRDTKRKLVLFQGNALKLFVQNITQKCSEKLRGSNSRVISHRETSIYG
jgi:hypothetical protein